MWLYRYLLFELDFSCTGFVHKEMSMFNFVSLSNG